MTPFDFLKTVWPSDGYYCLAVPVTKGYRHEVFTTIEDAAAFVDTVKDTKDVFFCIHSLKQEKVWNPNKGENGGFSHRLQTNMQEARCFFFDLDVGNGEQKYESQKDALLDLINFTKTTGLPVPLVASSGGGLHVYWLLDISLPSNEWQTYAARLKQLAAAHGLKADPARTTDTASVLRVAGTFNHKKGLKREVVVIKKGVVTKFGDFKKKLDDALIRAGVDIQAKKAVAVQDDDFFGPSNMDKDDFGPPVTFGAVLRICAQARYLAVQRGRVDEPAWQASLNLVRFCAKSEKLTHWISDQHEDYDPDKTDAKVQRLITYRNPQTNKPMGPTLCSKLAAVCGAARCQGCAYKDRNSSPIVFARDVDKAPDPIVHISTGPVPIEYVIPPPPKPYNRKASGGINMKTTNKEGEEFYLQIYENDLYPIRQIRNYDHAIEQQVWRVEHKHGPIDFVMDADAYSDRKKFASTVANAGGIYVVSDAIKGLQDYMSAYIAELRRTAAAEAQSNTLGWTEDRSAFVLPDKILHTDGTVRPTNLSSNAAEHAKSIHKSGTLERQVELLEFYNHPAYVANQAVILAALAAPMFHATGHAGTIINCTGEPGASKSTTLYTAAALWGQPELYTINGTTDGSTARARTGRLSVFSNLPVCVDEITTMGVDEAKALAMGISQPGNRDRLLKNGDLQKQPHTMKSTLMITTANNSLHNLLATDNAMGTAGSMRIFEIFFRKQHIHQKWAADDYLHELKQNYGHVGEIVMAYVVKHYASTVARIREEMKAIDQEANIQSGERFWSAYPATAIVIGRIAVELGLIKYNIEAIRQWFIRVQIPLMRGIVHDEYATPHSILTDYLESISGNTIVVNKIGTSGLINVMKKPNGALLAHLDYDDKSMWVLRKGFHDYCTKIGADCRKILTDLSATTIGKDGKPLRLITNAHIRKVMGAGTEYSKSQSYCFVLNLRHPDALNVPDLEVVTNPTAIITPPQGILKAIEEG